jgi:acetoacetyl-CoA reductase/3-oxoacyl-[acyl-carrier protein] reductase
MKRRTSIITGASRGIGRAIAVERSSQGDNVVIIFCDDERGAQQTAELCRGPGTACICRADVSSAPAVQAAVGSCIQQFGAVNVLVNNAGVNIDKPIEELTEADWDRVVDVNMKGVFLMSQAVTRVMREQADGGVIINVAASTGIRGRVKGVNYCASKAGVLVMTKCLALELAPSIRVNCVIPGVVQTDEAERLLGLDDPARLQATLKGIPLGHVGDPVDVARAVSFLCEESGRYITGQKIIIDGGQFMY